MTDFKRLCIQKWCNDDWPSEKINLFCVVQVKGVYQNWSFLIFQVSNLVKTLLAWPLKMGCMHQGPRDEQCPIAIQFLARYVIVMGVSNQSGHINYGDEASLWTCSSWIYKKPHLRLWMLKFWSKLQTEAFKVSWKSNVYFNMLTNWSTDQHHIGLWQKYCLFSWHCNRF